MKHSKRLQIDVTKDPRGCSKFKQVLCVYRNGLTISKKKMIEDEVEKVARASASFERLNYKLWNRRGIKSSTYLYYIQSCSPDLPDLNLYMSHQEAKQIPLNIPKKDSAQRSGREQLKTTTSVLTHATLKRKERKQCQASTQATDAATRQHMTNCDGHCWQRRTTKNLAVKT